jgi:Protein of unknown function (DUF1329)
MKSLRLLWGTAITLALVLGLCGLSSAQLTYDVANYKALADADSNDTIPVGTKITVHNWQQYKRFMQMWMQAAFSGQYKWHVGAEPEYTVEVGPTHHYQMYRHFLDDTEKYGGQAQLVPLPSGGFSWKGYVAGIPFPKPAEPNLAAKLVYDTWANFRPKIMDFRAYNWLVDNYGNVTNLESDDTFFRLMHLSDPPGGPINLPSASGTYYSSRFTVVLPEQSKYTTELTLRPDDPTKIEEIYVFLPSLRRSLRLSSAARCAPILGTDFVEDDNAWMPPNFKVSLLGKKKLLAPVMEYDKAFQKDSYLQPPTGFPGWPKHSAIRWELRNFYLLNLEWLTSLGTYCYSQRVFYMDTETNASTPLESYDRNGKFWKVVWIVGAPINFRGQHTLIEIASIAQVSGVDFQNSHITATIESPTTIDEDGAGSDAGPAPAQFWDVGDVTTPGSLSRIMK